MHFSTLFTSEDNLLFPKFYETHKEIFGHLVIDLDLRASDCLRYCSNTIQLGPSSFSLPLKRQKRHSSQMNAKKIYSAAYGIVETNSKTGFCQKVKFYQLFFEVLLNVNKVPVRIPNLINFEKKIQRYNQSKNECRKETSYYGEQIRFLFSYKYTLFLFQMFDSIKLAAKEFVQFPKHMCTSKSNYMYYIFCLKTRSNMKKPQLS